MTYIRAACFVHRAGTTVVSTDGLGFKEIIIQLHEFTQVR